MGIDPIITTPNEGDERVEYAVQWDFEAGHRTYTLRTVGRVACEEAIASPPRPDMTGTLVQCTVTRTPWTPVLPASVLRLDQIAAEEYGGIRVAELGEGVVEGYTVVAFTDDVERAFAAVRAHMLMVHNESPALSLFREDEPVRWWQVYSTCGCGDVCPHGEDEDHDCAREGLPPCRQENEDGAAWIGQLCEQDAPGALPFVEIEVGPELAPDERVAVLRSLLTDAEQKLSTLAKKCLVVRPTLDKPYSDEPTTTPWKKFVEQPAREAYDLAVEIRRELKRTGVAS